MKKWLNLGIVLAIVILVWPLRGIAMWWSAPRDLLVVSRNEEHRLATLRVQVYNSKLPKQLLLLLDAKQQKILKNAKVPFEVIGAKFTPGPPYWFIDSDNVCSPCFNNTVYTFSDQVLWKSDKQFLIRSDLDRVRKIINNYGSGVSVYHLDRDEKVLTGKPLPPDYSR